MTHTPTERPGGWDLFGCFRQGAVTSPTRWSREISQGPVQSLTCDLVPFARRPVVDDGLVDGSAEDE